MEFPPRAVYCSKLHWRDTCNPYCNYSFAIDCNRNKLHEDTAVESLPHTYTATVRTFGLSQVFLGDCLWSREITIRVDCFTGYMQNDIPVLQVQDSANGIPVIETLYSVV